MNKYTMTAATKSALVLDSRNRALRAFLVNVVVDVATMLGLTVNEIVQTQPEHDIQLGVIAVLLGKTVAATIGSYLLRRFGDPSGVWTPLPPAPQAEPAEPIDLDDEGKPFEADV